MGRSSEETKCPGVAKEGREEESSGMSAKLVLTGSWDGSHKGAGRGRESPWAQVQAGRCP